MALFYPIVSALWYSSWGYRILLFKQTHLCDEAFNLRLSEGGAVAMVKRAGQAVFAEAERIGERVRQSAVIGSDETSARVQGRNRWQWVFVSQAGEYHLILPGRGYDVIETFMRECEAEVWVCDCWRARIVQKPHPK